VGLITPAVLQILEQHRDLFRISKTQVAFVDGLDTYEKRTQALDTFFRSYRRQQARSKQPNELPSENAAGLPSSLLCSLAGWRGENYAVGGRSCSAAPLFEMERAATPILGVRQYGVHINGMVEDGGHSRGTSLWLQVRAKSKPTFPGKLGRL
jgi:hypothetical protein